MQRNNEVDFLRAVGTPLPRKAEGKAQSTPPSASTPSRRQSVRQSLTPGSGRPRNSRDQDDDKQPNLSRRWPWLLGCGLGAVLALALLIILWLRTPSPAHMYKQLPDGRRGVDVLSLSSDQAWRNPGVAELPALPEGKTCGLEERDTISDRIYAHMKHSLEQCEGKVSALQQQAQSCQGLQQEIRTCEQEAKAAGSQLKGRERREKALEARAAAAEAKLGSVQEELKRTSAAVSDAEAHAVSSTAELQRVQEACAAETDAALAESSRAAEVAVRRAEELEGSLSECRGRLVGLGEGCGRCWQMLEDAQDEGRTVVRRAASWSFAGCMAVTLVAYIYARLMRRKVTHLQMECEKLRCAALEAEGGFRQRTSRACNRRASAGPAQQFLAR